MRVRTTTSVSHAQMNGAAGGAGGVGGDAGGVGGDGDRGGDGGDGGAAQATSTPPAIEMLSILVHVASSGHHELVTALSK